MTKTILSKKFNNKNIAFLGLGSENEALIDFLLKKKIDCNISVFDNRESDELGGRYLKYDKKENVFWNLGKKKNDLQDFDVLFRSPGWPLFDQDIKSAQKKNKDLKLTSSMNLFFEICPTKNMIGVTGTKGKGTTSALIYEIIKASKKRVFLGGNIGTPPFSFFDRIKKSDYVVLELSSFQLEDIEHSPKIAVITNFSREHLRPADPNNPNFHKSLKDYWRAKTNIFKYQKNSDKLIANIKLTGRLEAEPAVSERIFFHSSQLESKLIGEHNKENIAAAETVAKTLRINKELIKQTVKRFKGLEHRLEFVGQKKGAYFYNDSFATTPEATLTALKSFSENIILLAGGADKGASFSKLAGEINKKAKLVLLFRGGGSVKIKKALLAKGFAAKKIKIVKSMKEAFDTLLPLLEKKDVVLLSTACASFGVFKNYKERGKLFKKEFRKK